MSLSCMCRILRCEKITWHYAYFFIFNVIVNYEIIFTLCRGRPFVVWSVYSSGFSSSNRRRERERRREGRSARRKALSSLWTTSSRLMSWWLPYLLKVRYHNFKFKVTSCTLPLDQLIPIVTGPRPIPPDVFNEIQFRQEILEYYRSHHRSPGEPLFVPELRHTHAITQQCPREEQLRRDEVARSQLYVKVLFNNQQVSQTKKG